MIRLSPTSASVPAAEQPPTLQGAPRPPFMRDTMHPHPGSDMGPDDEESRSPLSVVIDCFLCIKSVVTNLFHRICSLFITNKKAAPTGDQAPPPWQPEVASSDVDDERLSETSEREEDILSTIGEEEEEEEPNYKLSDLSTSEEEMQNITYIIKTLANETAFLMPTSELRRRGQALSHLHPFLYLKHALCNERLFNDFKIMKSRSFGIIWAQYADEFASKLAELHGQNVLLPYLRSFAEDTGRNYETLRLMLIRKDFRAFTDYLVDSPSSPSSIHSSEHSSSSSDGSSFQQPLATRKVRQRVEVAAQHTAPLSLHAATPRRQATLQRQMTVRRRSNGPLSPVKSDQSFPFSPSQPHPTSRQISIPPSFSREASIMSLQQDDIEASEAPSHLSASTTFNPALLPMHEIHKQKLKRIFEDVAHMSSFSLMWQITSIKSDWNKLKEVHPLRLLIEIFNNPAHVANLALILQVRMRKDYFLTDFAITLKAAATPEQLAPFISEFCRVMNVEDRLIASSIIIGGEWDWKHVIKYLLGKRQLEASLPFSNL